MKRVRVDPWGPDALLVRYEAPGEEEAFVRGQAIGRYLEASPMVGLAEVTPGFDTVLLEFETGKCPRPGEVAGALERVGVVARDGVGEGRLVELPVVYDGPDLERVARHAGMGVDEVVARHGAGVYRVHMMGFAPGFAYLGGLDPRLHTPRLATPRARVPAGSVAIGGGHAGVYPLATAGGWNLLGRTERVLLDAERAAAGRADAFVLQPGDAVRFVPVPGGGGGRQGS